MPLWQQEQHHHVHQQQLPQEHNQHLGQFNEDEDEFMVDSWRNANPFHNHMGNILGEDVQLLK